MVHPQGKSTTERAIKLTDTTAEWLLNRAEDSVSSQPPSASQYQEEVSDARASAHLPSSDAVFECLSSDDDPMGWGFDMGLID